MKTKMFTYQKEDGSKKSYNLLKIKEDATSMEGLSIGDLKPEEVAKIETIYSKFEEELKPYIKHWRKFLKSRIIENKEEL
jgi:hypothetical protein